MIPQFEAYMLPLLQYLADGKEHSTDECANAMCDHFHLTEEERNAVDSRHLNIVKSRMGWAKSYMKMAGLILNDKKGKYTISPEGRKVLQENPQVINRDFLLRYPSFQAFFNGSRQKKEKKEVHVNSNTNEQTPLEQMTSAYDLISHQLASEIVDKVMAQSPQFFERLVVDLLRKMGYGISSKVTQYSGDGGIDGIIEEDKLGLDNIYIQAKRWSPDNKVSRPALQAFIGAIADHGGSKGVFITTSSFT